MTAAEPTKSAGWISAWMPRGGGRLPDVLGLTFLAVLLVALLAAATVTQRIADRHVQAAAQRCAEVAADALAAAIEHASPTPSEIQALAGKSLGTNSTLTARYYDAAGRMLFELAPNSGGAIVVKRTLRGKDGAAGGAIEVLHAPIGATPVWSQVEWWLAAAAVLGAFFALNRWLRRRLRPVAAVEHNLREYAEHVECELRGLALSDSFGATARTWNTLIQELATLREQVTVRSGRGTDDMKQKFETRQLRDLLERLPFGVLRVGEDLRITYANGAAGQMLAASGALTGNLLSEVIDDPQLARAISEPGAASLRGASFDQSQAEGRVAVRVHVAPLDADRRSGERLVTVQDISHLHEAERARDNFLYHVTHELRTPLTNIQAYAETLTKPDFDDEQTRKECYNIIISETRRLSRLVEDILSVSQLEVGSARVEPGDVDAARLLRQVVQDHHGYADEKQIELTLRLPPRMPKIRGDKQKLAVLFTNLVGNALKYTPSGGKVQVNAELESGLLRVSVADTGVGICPEDQQHVFEKFYRAAAAEVQEQPGTGLGLAIAREVARLHGGEITLTSEVGRGSTFCVELPAPAEN